MKADIPIRKGQDRAHTILIEESYLPSDLPLKTLSGIFASQIAVLPEHHFIDIT
jgi:hypothetical protein